jgi:hypothetical protein
MTNLIFESFWISLMNSDRVRRLTKGDKGGSLLRSPAFQKLNLARRYLISYYLSQTQTNLFNNLSVYCMFIGHNKSGTSLLGSLLDAHPNIILADEADALQYVSAGFSREQIFHLLLKASRKELLKGRVTARRLKPYAFLVPGQWQGTYSTLKVIGDSTSGSSTRQLTENPHLLDQLEQSMSGLKVKMIQVIRNPFDPIAVSMVRGKRSFQAAVHQYFNRSEGLLRLRNQLDEQRLLPVKYEEFISNPREHLQRLLDFLGLEATEDYLKACTSILHKSPDQNRNLIQWEPDQIRQIQENIKRYEFLAGYTFEN